MPYIENFERVLQFYKMMDIIGKSDSNIQLVRLDYIKMRFKPGNSRIAIIHEYLMKNYKKDVDLKKLADLVSMAEGSLCRFFKSNTGLTIFEYLQLLMDKDLSISDICFDSGFNNLSHFNKQFRKNTDVPPSE